MLASNSLFTALDFTLLTNTKVWLCILISLSVVRLASLHYQRGLNKYNGPFWASLTNFWRLCHAYRNKHREPMIHMHDEYGDVVRMGPNVLSFRQPQAIRDIYGPGKHFKKSDYYPVQAPVGNGQVAHTLFSNPDQTWHNNLRRSIGASFTMNAVVKYEHLVESTVLAFLKELNERFADKEDGDGIVDFHTWILYFTFDVMGDLTYSVRHGFLEKGKDMYGIINFVKKFVGYGFIAGQMPSVDLLLRHNPVLMWLERREWISSNTFPGVPLAINHMRERQKRYAKNEKHATDREDLLDKFLTAKRERPEIVTDREVLGLSLSTILAGSLTAFFYHLLRHPECYTKLQSEIDKNLPPKDPSMPFYTAGFAPAKALPYLNACVQEAFRMHPAFGFNYERIVPPSGATIYGHHVPGGTIVGVNPWVIQRDYGVFGADANDYRPERWLGGAERVKAMEKTMLQFGAGDHICLGKNVSALEIFKLVPALMRNFEMKLENPEKKWTVSTRGSVRMRDFDIRIRRRQDDGLHGSEPGAVC